MKPVGVVGAVVAGLVFPLLTPKARPETPAEASRPAKAPALNQKVVQFARAARGKQVGNGECWTLADQALRHAGAQPPGTGGLGLYTFGRKLGEDDAILPGDVIQFEKARFVSRDVSGWYVHSLPHHTAIVCQASGTEVTLLHQNAGGNRTVQVLTLNLAARMQGTVEVYRPQPRRAES